ncbi:MAG: hypothetical protein WCA10_15575 [Terracidiphilus sp.]
MSDDTLIPYLPKLKDGSQVSVSLPKKLREWDDQQGQIRLRHLADGIDVPQDAGSVYSIPDPWARAILFRRALFDVNHPLHDRIQGEWRGILALIALKRIRRFNELSVRDISLNPEKADRGSFRYAITRILPGKENSIVPAATWAAFHLLSWHGTRREGKPRAFAMTSPWTLVATGADYARILSSEEVPWFGRGVLEDPCTHLSDLERRMMADWVLKVRDGLPLGNIKQIIEALEEFAKALDKNADGKLKNEEALSEDRLGFRSVALYENIDRPIRPAAEVISDCAIKTSRPRAPLYILIDSAVASSLNRAERDITVQGMVNMTTVRRYIPEQDRMNSGPLPITVGQPQMYWCTSDFFFESTLIYEQTRSIGVGGEVGAFPGARSIRVVEGSRSEGRHVVLPINPKVLELLTPEDLEKSLTLEWLNNGDAHFRLSLKIETLAAGMRPGTVPVVRDGPFTVVLEKKYTQNEMVRVAKLPAICIWPDFYFEEENADDSPERTKASEKNGRTTTNRWSMYYLFESWREVGNDTSQFMVNPVGAEMHCKERMVTMLTQEEDGQRTDEEYFQVTTLKSYPEALVCSMPRSEQRPLQRGEGVPSGILLLRPAKSPNVHHGMNAVLGVDFGTTGTAIYQALGQTGEKNGEIKRLSFENRLVQITNTDTGEYQRLTRDLFLPNAELVDGRILSIFQDFGARGERQPVRDGHVLFLENSATREFVHGDPRLILTDLKWSAVPSVNKATIDFLLQLCQQSLAELLVEGTQNVEIRYSYPTAFSEGDLSHFQGMWKSVLEQLRKVTSVPINLYQEVKNNCESIVAARYFSHSENVRKMIADQGAISLDIGGGTTDIAVWNVAPPQPESKRIEQESSGEQEEQWAEGEASLLAHMSVKFAGQDIFLVPLRKKPELLRIVDDGGAVSDAVEWLNKRLEKESSAYCAEVDAIISSHGTKLLEKLPAFAQAPGVKEMLEVVELGLRGIAFYTGLLLGRLVKDGLYDAAQQRIGVFVGGNGSRLFDWCALGKAEQESAIVQRFGQSLLAGANFASGNLLRGKRVVISLSERPKEEVAFGLVMRPEKRNRVDDYVNPMAGEDYLVGGSQNREPREWSTAPDLQTLGTLPVRVNPELPVIREFLKSLGLNLNQEQLADLVSDVDAGIQDMKQKAKRALAEGASPGKANDPVRKQPLFILGLSHLVTGRVRKLGAMKLMD